VGRARVCGNDRGAKVRGSVSFREKLRNITTATKVPLIPLAV
jgi:hypothetical protein